MRRIVTMAVAGCVALISASTCGGSAKPNGGEPAYTLTGVIVLMAALGQGWEGQSYLKYLSDGSWASPPSLPSPPSCSGSKGYSDLKEEAQVTVKDDQSAIIGVGQLTSGTGVMGTDRRSGDGFDTRLSVYYAACEFSFTVSGLPHRPFYTVSSGTRGGVTYTFDDLELKNWSVTLTIGDRY